MAPASFAESAGAAASRSVSSPLAVSVSGLSFQSRPAAERRNPSFAAMNTCASASGGSPRHSTRRMASPTPSTDAAATSGSSRELAPDYRGKCLYQSRKCENERALKRNGKAHNLCDEHRTKQNQHQRKFDAKKFSRKRRGDSDDDAATAAGAAAADNGEGDNDGRDSLDAGEARVQESEQVARSTRKRKGPVRESSMDGTAAAAAPAALPQRKIRRFDGAKIAGRRQSDRPVASEAPVVVPSTASGSLEGPSRLLQPPYYAAQHANPATHDHDRRLKEENVAHLHARVSSAPHPQYQYPQSFHEYAEPPAGSTFRPAPDASARSGPPNEFPGPRSAPLLPLAAIIGPSAGSRISPTRHAHQSAPRHGFSPSEHQRRYHRAEAGAEVSEPHSAPAERRGPFSPPEQFQQQFQPRPREYERHHQQYIPSQPTHRSLPPPTYARSMAPHAAPLARPHPFASSSGRQPHTSVSPRGVPVMHPSAHAISPHHPRLQAPPGYVLTVKHEYYGQAHASMRRDEQDEKQSASGDWHRARPQYSTSPPLGPGMYHPPGPSRILPPLAASAVQRALPSPSLVGPHRNLHAQHHQHHQGPHPSGPPPPFHHQHQRQHHPHCPQQQQQQPYTQTTGMTAATPMLPSLAPLRPRNPSLNPASRHFSPPTSI
ncbi:hypothetical protein PybrP1_013211 [[Pythium] brassicae (nom. inval.)]|nr:hypothetical protein PybrP1_013211 [[Pythium] brassicae (nom. inval.)]